MAQNPADDPADFDLYDIDYGVRQDPTGDQTALHLELLVKEDGVKRRKKTDEYPFLPYCYIDSGAFEQIPWNDPDFGPQRRDFIDEPAAPDGYDRLCASLPKHIGQIRRALDEIRDDREAARQALEWSAEGQEYVHERLVDDSTVRTEETEASDLPPGAVYSEKSQADVKRNAAEVLHDTEEPPLTYQADVPYVRRVMIDEGIALDAPDPSDVLFFDIEVDPSDGFPEVEDADAQILSFAAVDGNGNEHFISGSETEIFNALVGDPANRGNPRINDRGLLGDYFVLIGWNSESFDLPYLKNRMEKVGGYYWPSSEIIHFDGMGLFRSFKRDQLDSYSLDAVAEAEVGDSKDMAESESYQNLREWFDSGSERLREYNLQDARLTKKISDEYSLVEATARVCAEGYTRMSSITYDNDGYPQVAVGKAVDSVVLREAQRVGYVFGDRGRYADTGKFPGGYVFDPVPGKHSWVITADFSSMYPNIIRALNIGENTWIEDGSSPVKGVNEAFGAGERSRGGFNTPDSEQGLLAAATEKLDTVAQDYKDRKNSAPNDSEEEAVAEAMYMGIKSLYNSSYGVVASPLHRYYLPGMSEHITETGQFLIRECERFVEAECPEVKRVVGGDTDSVFIELAEDDPDAEPKAVAAVANTVVDKLNDHIKTLAAEDLNANAEVLNLDVDYVADRFVQTDKKKAYAYHRVWEDGEPSDKKKVTGLKCKKSDTMDVASDLQRALVDALLEDRDTDHIIEAFKHAVYSGSLDDKLVRHKGLGKRLSCACDAEDSESSACDCDVYAGKSAHTRAAKQYNLAIDRDLITGAKLGRGDKVDYIKYGSGTTKTVHPAIRENQLPHLQLDPEDPNPKANDEPFCFTPERRKFLWKNYCHKAIEQVNLDPTKGEQSRLAAFA